METLDVIDLVRDLEADGVQLRMEGDALRFRAPDGVMTAERLDRVRLHRGALLEVIRSRDTPLPVPPHIEDAEDVWIPLRAHVGFAQEGFRMTFIRHWRGSLDPTAYQAALDELVRRHSILRTRYRFEPVGHVWAITEKERRIPIEVTDLSGLDAPDADAAGRVLAAKLVGTPFDLETGPLLRAALIRMPGGTHTSVFVICHSIFDAWSARVLFTELLALYRAAKSGTRAELPPLPRQFRDHARRHYALRGSEAGYQHLLFWRDRIRQIENPILFAADRRTPPEHSISRPPVIGRVGSDVLAALKAHLRERQSTLFQAAAVAIAMALTRWSAGREMFFWAVHTGRDLPELAAMIGCIAGPVPFHVRLRDDPSFLDACSEAKNSFRTSMPHFDVTPLDLAPMFKQVDKRTPSTRPLLNYFATDALETASEADEDEAARSDWVGPGALFDANAPLPLAFYFHESALGLGWTIRYKNSQYEDSTIEALSAGIEKLLSSVALRPQARLSELVIAACKSPTD